MQGAATCVGPSGYFGFYHVAGANLAALLRRNGQRVIDLSCGAPAWYIRGNKTQPRQGQQIPYNILNQPGVTPKSEDLGLYLNVMFPLL